MLWENSKHKDIVITDFKISNFWGIVFNKFETSGYCC